MFASIQIISFLPVSVMFLCIPCVEFLVTYRLVGRQRYFGDYKDNNFGLITSLCLFSKERDTLSGSAGRRKGYLFVVATCFES